MKALDEFGSSLRHSLEVALLSITFHAQGKDLELCSGEQPFFSCVRCEISVTERSVFHVYDMQDLLANLRIVGELRRRRTL